MDSSAHYGSNSRPDRIWDWTDRGNQRGQAYAPGFCWIIHDPIGCERCILGAYMVRTQARVHTPIYLPKFETVIYRRATREIRGAENVDRVSHENLRALLPPGEPISMAGARREG